MMIYPKVARTRLSEVCLAVEVDSDSYPWPTLTLWDLSVTAPQWLEWGVSPSSQFASAAREVGDGTMGTICFRFEAVSGRLYGIEIPGNLLMSCLRLGVCQFNSYPEEIVQAFVDVSFWIYPARRTERQIEATVRARVGRGELLLQFSNSIDAWLRLSEETWLGVDSAMQIAGIRCLSETIDFPLLASGR